MKIAFASADWARRSIEDETPTYGGANWIRFGQVARELRARGHEVVEGLLVRSPSGRLGVQTWEQYHYAQETGEKTWDEEADLVVCQRWMNQELPDVIRVARELGQIVLQDLDDNFWAFDSHHQGAWTTSPERDPAVNRDHYRRSIEASSGVTVSTPYLADLVRSFGVEDVWILENRIDLDAYPRSLLREPPEAPRVGWAGAVPWRAAGDLRLLRSLKWFLDAQERPFVHLGAVDSRSLPREVGIERAVEIALVPPDEYPRVLASSIDLGLVLLVESRFDLAKSWIKGLEYAAAGVPFVAAGVPEYRRLQESHGIGRTARKTKDWTIELRRLQSASARAEDQERNREAVEKLGIRDGVAEWEALYGDLLR